jgi:hypothetical protein
MPQFRVFYMKPDHFRRFSMGELPQLATLGATHVELRTVEAEGLEDVFRLQQAHHWGEDWRATNALLESKGLAHTSMSVGDVVADASGEYFAVAMAGFTSIGRETA